MGSLRLKAGLLTIALFSSFFLLSVLNIPRVCAYSTYVPTVDSSSGFTNPDESIVEDGVNAYTYSSAWIIWDLGDLYENVSAFEIKSYGSGSDRYNMIIEVSEDNVTYNRISQDTYYDFSPLFWRTIYIDEDYSTVRYIRFTTTGWFIDAVRCRTYPYIYLEDEKAYAVHLTDYDGISNSLGMGISKKDDDCAGVDYFWFNVVGEYAIYEFEYIYESESIHIHQGAGGTPTIGIYVSVNGNTWLYAGEIEGLSETLVYNGVFKYVLLNQTTSGTREIYDFYITVPETLYEVTVINGTYGNTTGTGTYLLGLGAGLVLTPTPINSSYVYWYYSNNGVARSINISPYNYVVAGNATLYPVFKTAMTNIFSLISFLIPIIIFVTIAGVAIIMVRGRRNS